MKKQMIFMMAGGLMTLAACNNGATTAPSEATIDSTVNAKMQIREAELMAKNDSIINAEVTRRVDSTLLAMQGTTSTRTGTRNNTKATPPPATPVKTTQDDKFDSRDNNTKQQITPEQKKAQDDKFNKRGG